MSINLRPVIDPDGPTDLKWGYRRPDHTGETNWVRAWRVDHNLNITQVAFRVGCSWRQVVAWENGEPVPDHLLPVLVRVLRGAPC